MARSPMTCRGTNATFVVLVLGFVNASSAQLSDSDFASLHQAAKLQGWTFTVERNPATDIPLENLCGLTEPPDWRHAPPAVSSPMMAPPTSNLPSSFDWRTQTGCPPIRNQGSCASCWAFSTLGA